MSAIIGNAIGDPPYHYLNGEQVAVVFRTDAALLRSVLPPLLQLPEGPARAVIRVVNPLRSTFGSYVGCYLQVPALFDGEPVLHALSMMKNSFPGAIAGREVWGMPMQVGDVTKEWHGDVMNVVASRYGMDFVRLSVRLEAMTDAPEPFGRTTSASRRQNFEANSTQHVLVTAESQRVGLEASVHWRGSSVLKLVGGQPGDDWSLFPVDEILETRYISAGGTNILSRGRVLAEW